MTILACSKQNPPFEYVKGLKYSVEELNVLVIQAFLKKNYKECNDTCRFKINARLKFDNRSFHYCKNYKNEFYKHGYSLSDVVEVGHSIVLKTKGVGELYFGGEGLKNAFTFSPVVYFPEQRFFYMECTDMNNKFFRFTGIILGARIFVDESCDVDECMELPNDMKGNLKNSKILLEDDSI